jgi:hydroxylaminobenzene mutase
MTDIQKTYVVLGLVLFLLGLLTGFVVPALKNPRMGVAAHMVGMTNGPFLIVIGLLWPYVHLAHAWDVVTVTLFAYGSYANWLAMQLGSLWGAGRKFAPGVSGDHQAPAAKERLVDFLLASLAPVMVVATSIVIVGVLR